MRIIKILVADEDQAEEITSLIEEGEANGLLDFPFTVRLTDELTPAIAKYNLYYEET